MPIETKFPVRYAETDQMGIVHHSVYPIWFECGRTELMKSHGLPYDELEKMGVMLPLLKVSVTFKYPLRYGETVIIKTSLAESSKVRLLVAYHVYSEGNDRLCALGFTEHAWTTSDLKPVNLLKYKPEVYEKLIPMFKETTGEMPK